MQKLENKYYDVKVECLLPATLTYRVFTDSPEKAADLIKNINPNYVKYKLIGKKIIKLTVYDACCTIVRYFKHILGH